MPAVLMEMLFHDDWKFYPDHVFAMDQIFQATVCMGYVRGHLQLLGRRPEAQAGGDRPVGQLPERFRRPGRCDQRHGGDAEWWHGMVLGQQDGNRSLARIPLHPIYRVETAGYGQ